MPLITLEGIDKSGKATQARILAKRLGKMGREEKYITIGCIEEGFWANLCRALGVIDFLKHQYTTNKDS